MSDEQQYKHPRDHLRFDPRQYTPEYADSLTEDALTPLIDEAALKVEDIGIQLQLAEAFPGSKHPDWQHKALDSQRYTGIVLKRLQAAKLRKINRRRAEEAQAREHTRRQEAENARRELDLKEAELHVRAIQAGTALPLFNLGMRAIVQADGTIIHVEDNAIINTIAAEGDAL